MSTDLLYHVRGTGGYRYVKATCGNGNVTLVLRQTVIDERAIGRVINT